MKFSIMNLRPANQNQPCDITAAIAFIFWHGKALIAQRGDQEDFLPGYWELVGGQVEAGENTEQACIREVKEESGLAPVWHCRRKPVPLLGTREDLGHCCCHQP